MKKYISALATLTAFIYLSSCNNANSGNAIELKFNLQKGSKYELAMDLEIKGNQQINGKNMDMDNNMGFTSLFEVKNDSASWKTVSSTITKISMDMNSMGRSMHFDTDMPMNDSGRGPGAMMGKVFGAMKGSEFTFTMNDRGEIGEMKAPKEKMLSGLPTDEDSTGAGVKSPFDEETMKQNLQQAFQAYPDKPVKPGDSWTKTITQKIRGISIKSENQYTLEAVNGDDATIKVTTKLSLDGEGKMNGAEVTMTGSGEGKTHYDIQTGMPTDAEIDMKMETKVKTGKTEVPMNMEMKVKIKAKKL